jgi:hypothetical protein
MSAPRKSAEEIAQVVETYRAMVRPSVQGAALRMGMQRATVQRILIESGVLSFAGPEPTPPDHVAIAGNMIKPEPEAEPVGEVERQERGDALEIAFLSDEKIETIEQAFVKSGADASVWFVKKFECNAYQVAMKVRRGQDAQRLARPDQPMLKQLWRVKIYCERLLPRPFQVAQAAVFARLFEAAPRLEPIRRARPRSPNLMVLDLFDVHFGKLAWARESGQDYDLRIAERVFREAFEDLLDQAVGREVAEILVPVGNDFFHIDSPRNETTSGTRVDTDGRYAKIIEAGEIGLIDLVSRARAIAPVKVIHVPGNHDRTASWHACRTLWAYFHRSPDVAVDFDPSPRKYHAFGRHLIGFTHGNEEKLDSLPRIMTTEAKAAFAASDYQEFHRGHFHCKREYRFLSVDTVDGMIVRNLCSLSATDAWHHLKGYVGGRRAAEAYFYDAASGNVANALVEIRPTA